MINMILDDASDRMQKAIEAYQRDLATVRTGRATPAMLRPCNGQLLRITNTN